jgi:hypothetical protein
MLSLRRFHAKIVIFVVLAPVAARAGAALSARMAHEIREQEVLARRCAGIVGSVHHEGRKTRAASRAVKSKFMIAAVLIALASAVWVPIGIGLRRN